MSNFFVARDRENNNQIVGVKLCDVDKVEFFESRFKGLNKPSEGEIGAQMSHPSIAKTLEYGLTTKNQPYIVMEFVDGPGLQVLVFDKNEELLKGKRLNLLIQMAEALNYVHKKEFIHRDICPRNYICSQDLKTVKLIDFGLTLPATRHLCSQVIVLVHLFTWRPKSFVDGTPIKELISSRLVSHAITW